MQRVYFGIKSFILYRYITLKAQRKRKQLKEKTYIYMYFTF